MELFSIKSAREQAASLQTNDIAWGEKEKERERERERERGREG
jgi:hypothetical protein